MKLKQVTLKTKIDRTLFALVFLVLGSVSLLTLLPLVDTAPSASAANDEEPTITINTGNDTALVTIAPDSATGTFATSSSSDITFGVSTNSICGYTLSVSTGDSSSVLSNGEYTIASITTPITAADFNTSTYNNRWGFKPNKYIDTSTNTVIDNTGEDAVFLPAPTSGRNLDRTSAPNSVDNEYSIAIGMRVNLDTAAGEYNNSLVILSVANPIIYNINFDTNAPEGIEISNFPNALGGSTQNTSIELPSGTPQREHYTFLGWCDLEPTNTNGIDACTGTHTNGAAAVSYQPGDSYTISHVVANTATLYAMWQIDTFTQTTRYRYENIDGTFTEWEDSEEVTMNYGETYTWDPTNKITDFDGTPFTNSSAISYTVTDDNNNDITFTRKQFTITKRYKLEDENGNYPEEFTADGTETVRYGADYTYLRNVAYYYNTGVEATNITEDITLDLLKERVKYQVYVNKGSSDIQSVTGAGSYRWGSTITISATKKADTVCRVYDNDVVWTKGSGWGGFADDYEASTVTGNTVQFIIGKGAATLRADIGYTDILQTVTFSSPNGDTITFDGVDYHDGDTTQAYCGTYDIAGTVTQQPMEDRIYLQDITPATCPTVRTRVYDNRDQEAYYIQKLADGNCWLLNNLKLDPETTVPLTTANTNMSPDIAFTLPASEAYNSGFRVYDQPNIYTGAKYKGNEKNIWWTTIGGTLDRQYFLDSAKLTISGPATLEFKEVSTIGVYYNYCAATAGTFCIDDAHDWTGDKIYDLCPAGWRMPRSGAVNSTNDFALLYQSYNSDALAAIEAFNAYGGGMLGTGGGTYNQNTWGYYWSSSIYVFEGVNGWAWRGSASWNNEVFRGAESVDRNVGHSVRCMMDIPAEP